MRVDEFNTVIRNVPTSAQYQLWGIPHNRHGVAIITLRDWYSARADVTYSRSCRPTSATPTRCRYIGTCRPISELLAMNTAEMADAMEYDGVLPETLVILVEA